MYVSPPRSIKENKKVSFFCLLLLSIIGLDFMEVFGKHKKKKRNVLWKLNGTLKGISALTTPVMKLCGLDSGCSVRKRKHIYLYLMDVPFRAKEPLLTLAVNLLPGEFLANIHLHLMDMAGHMAGPHGFAVALWNSRICWSAHDTSSYWLQASPNSIQWMTERGKVTQ